MFNIFVSVTQVQQQNFFLLTEVFRTTSMLRGIATEGQKFEHLQQTR